MSSDSFSLFGIDGKMIGTYTAGANWNNTQTQIQLSFYSTTQRVYFGSKLVATLDWQGYQHGVVQDRLESVGKYYPFGEERNSPPLSNDQLKFATYTRDSSTGLDYADQRYYASTFGRFMSADAYQASGVPSDPASWNRYAYVQDDPVNYQDPQGLYIPPPVSLNFTIILTPALAALYATNYQLAYSANAIAAMLALAGQGRGSVSSYVQNAQSLARKLKNLDCDVLGIFNISGQAWNNNLDNLINGTPGQSGSGIIDGSSLQTVHVFDLWAHYSSGVPDSIKALGNPTIGDVFKNGYGGEKPDAIGVYNYPTIYINGSVFTSGNDMANIALMMHEILHTLGFTHEQIMDKLKLTGTNTGAINENLGQRCHLEKLVQ